MADVFVSYAREDRDRAGELVAVLRAQGWSVWWDQDIPAGANWGASIDQERRAATCMIVLWSSSSIASENVQDEAHAAKNRKALVPAMIERVEIPYGFGMLQAPDLSDWTGGTDHPGLVQVLVATRTLLRRSTKTIKKPPPGPWPWRKWLRPAALLAPLPIAAALGALKPSRFRVQATLRAAELQFRVAHRQPLLGKLAVTELGASRLAEVDLPRPRRAAPRVEARDRLLLQTTGRDTATLALSEVVLPESTLVGLRVDAPGAYHVTLEGHTHPLRVDVAGRLRVLAPPRGVVDFEPGQARLGPDSGMIDLDLGLPDTATVSLAGALEVRGLDFTRVDRYREGEVSDDVASTLDTADVVITALRRAIPPLGDEGRLGLEGATGTIHSLRLTSAGVSLRFDGSVRRLVVGSGAEQQDFSPTWFNVITARYDYALIAALALYAAVAGYLGLLLWRRR